VCPLHAPGRQLSHVAPPEPQLSSSVPGQQVEPLQHPVGHDDGPQKHMLLEQYWASGAHGWPLVLPHVQTPMSHVSALIPQGWHWDPWYPQLSVSGVVMQLVPAQHPEHEVESHKQVCEELQYCPAPHWAFVPQRHTPAVQLSAVAGVPDVQSAHETPSVPQVVVEEVLQLPDASQHPLGHESAVELQTQTLPEQTCPAAQTGPVPQRQAPVLEQWSALVGSHAVQAAPPTPHVASVEVSQLAPEQHPLGQLAAVQPVHTPPTQFWVPGHCSHDEPLVPQS
jgi:hypothetical protein